MIGYGKGARTFERHVDIDHEGVPVSSYCTLPEQADVWFKAFNKAKAMCGGSTRAKRTVPAKERVYLDALVRGVYLKHDVAAGATLTDDDVYFAIPLLKGQISTREFASGEVVKYRIAAHEPVLLDDVIADYAGDAQLAALIGDRGLEPMPGERKVAVNQ